MIRFTRYARPEHATLLAVIVSCTAAAQEPSTDTLSDSLAVAGAEVAAAVTRGFDALDPAVRNALAPLLADWIADTRRSARERGVDEIPREIREALTGYVPGEVLDRVRWRIDDSTLSVQRGLFSLGHTPAVTVDDVILFSNAAAAGNAKLWAHEIYHVMQYRNWGLDGFVDRYLADYSAVEHEASEFRWRWMTATGRVPHP